MNDSIYYSTTDKFGMFHRHEHKIKPTTQIEANWIYEDLDMYMSPEAVYQDGEATAEDAAYTFNFYLRKALLVEEQGFLPQMDGDVFEKDVSPSSIDAW